MDDQVDTAGGKAETAEQRRSDRREAKPARAPQTQAKSIILFSDGTGNSSAKLFKTNVFRLYEAVDLGPPSEGKQRQIAYYDNGVGTSAFSPMAMLGGVFGIGLRRNILEIYRYACRNYDPDAVPIEGSDIAEKGDHIYGFGFSRGAFTMRLVIGLIADQGLIPYTDEKELERKSIQAWKAFRRTSRRRAIQWIAGLFRREQPKSEVEAVSRGGSVEDAPTQQTRKDYDPADNHRPVIRMIGVFDTVAAYGGPVAEITRAIDNWIYPLSMPNYALHPRVRCARHALALDDERDSFWPLLWDEVAERQMFGSQVDGKDAPWLNEERLEQVWFAGVHADVGGGYPDESLSYVSLLWMIEEGNQFRLRTVDSITERYRALANSFGPMHDSRTGFSSYYRYQPRKIRAFLAKPKNDEAVTATLSLRDPLIGTGRSEKGLLETVVVHESVLARIATGTDGYAPIVLPDDYRVVPPGELTETKALETTGDDPASLEAQQKPADAQPARRPANQAHLAAHTPLLPPHIRNWLSTDAMRSIAKAMERAWDYVWWRRIFYFATVLATVALVAMPWWVISHGGTAVEGSLQRAWDSRNAIGNLIRLPGSLLPDFTNIWIDTWADHSILFLILVVAIVAFRRLGARFERKMRDRARAIWHGRVPRIPPASAGCEPTGLDPHQPSWLERMRNSRSYQRALQIFKWIFLPNFVFAPLLAFLILLLGLGIVTQASQPVIERASMCPGGETAPQATFPDAIVLEDFRTDALCNATGQLVSRAKTYEVTFHVREPWQDGSTDATPEGLTAGELPWLAGYAGLPLRRMIDARYLEPLAAVRERGGGLFGRDLISIRQLDLQPVPGQPGTFQARFSPPADGELSLFANDAVLPFYPEWFYSAGPGRNGGTACVTIVAVRDSSASGSAAVAPAASPPAGAGENCKTTGPGAPPPG